MMMNRSEAVSEVLSLYEKIDCLERANEDLLRAKSNRLREEKNDGKKPNLIEEKLARYGRESLMRDGVGTWRGVNAYRTEEGVIRFSPGSFEEWLDGKLSRRDIPSYMSRDDVVNALYGELGDMYRREINEARKLLLEKEKEAKEEAE